MKKGLLILLSMALSTGALAADLKVRLKDTPPNPFQYPTTGLYAGVGTEGGAGAATLPNGSVEGLNPNSVTTTSIDAHLLVGYVWGVPNTSMFVGVEARAGWQNFNGNSPGFSFSGPLAFEQSLQVGAPVDLIMASLPTIFGGLTPPPFTPPNGTTVSNAKWYIAAALDERDISLNSGQAANKVWAIAGSLKVGQKNLLSNGLLADIYAKVRFDDKGVCVGSVAGVGCASVGTTYLAGINIDFGI